MISPFGESQVCSPFVANMHTLLLDDKTESEGWGLNKILQNGGLCGPPRTKEGGKPWSGVRRCHLP